MQKNESASEVRSARQQDIRALDVWYRESGSAWGVAQLLEEHKASRYSIDVLFNKDCAIPSGFIVYQSVMDQCEVFYLAVDSAKRRQGVAATLLEHLIDCSKSKAISSIFLEVRASNEAAINLYKKTGFKQINIRKNYYPEAGSGCDRAAKEDAVIFQYLIN